MRQGKMEIPRSKSHYPQRVLVVAGKTIQVFARRIDVAPWNGAVFSKDVLVEYPLGTPSSQIKEELAEAGYEWHIDNKCASCGGPRPCLRDD